MQRLYPQPQFPPLWWESHRSDDAIPVPDEIHGPGMVTERSWVISATFGTKAWGHTQGVWPLFFPTATDALLWLRFHVLAGAENDAKVGKMAGEIVKMIDNAPPNTNTVDLFRELKPMLLRTFPEAEIVAIESIHEWLSEGGSEDELRILFETDDIVCHNGHWTMPQQVWDKVFPAVCANDYETLGLHE